MLRIIIDYFWPKLPACISEETQSALKADLKESSGLELGDDHRVRVSPWLRMKDREARSANCEWLSRHAFTFFKRWAFLSMFLLSVAWMTSGILIVEIPTTLGGVLAAILACSFFYAHRTLNI
jgi:hypothetical protein